MWASLLLLLPIASALLVNVTVERNDPSITYFPKYDWREAWPGLKINGHPGATASLNFTGVAVYYQGWLWSSLTFVTAQVDHRAPFPIDLTDYSYAGDRSVSTPTASASFVVALGMPDILHTIVISKPETQRSTVVGRLIYTTEHPPPSTSSLPAKTSDPLSSPTAAPTGSRSKNLKIVLPSVIGGLAAVTVVLLIIWSARRRAFQGGNVAPFKWLSREKRDDAYLLDEQYDREPNLILVTPAEKDDYAAWQID